MRYLWASLVISLATSSVPAQDIKVQENEDFIQIDTDALQATINKQGRITSVKVLSGDAILSRAAVEAVNQWKYKPYFLNGEPVDIQTQITVNFKLP